jgi:hypothetical protein
MGNDLFVRLVRLILAHALAEVSTRDYAEGLRGILSDMAAGDFRTCEKCGERYIAGGIHCVCRDDPRRAPVDDQAAMIEASEAQRDKDARQDAGIDPENCAACPAAPANDPPGIVHPTPVCVCGAHVPPPEDSGNYPCRVCGCSPLAPGQQSVLGEVIAERARQDAKWGGPVHDDAQRIPMWCEYVRTHTEEAEYYGQFDPRKSRKYLIEVAALAVAAVESIDRRVKS